MVAKFLGKAYSVSSSVEWSVPSVKRAWDLLKSVYNHNGYELDESKSGMSLHKATYLGLSSVCGIDLPSGLKTASKGGWMNPFGSSALGDLIERLKGYSRAEQANLLPPEEVHWFYTTIACVFLAANSSMIEKNDVPGLRTSFFEADPGIHMTRHLKHQCNSQDVCLLLSLILPEAFGGFAWPDMIGTFFVNSSSALENALAQLYAVATDDKENHKTRILFCNLYRIMTEFMTASSFTKRSSWGAMKNVFSVSVKRPGGARDVLRNYAVKEMFNTMQSEDLNMASIIKNQHSNEFKTSLDLLQATCPLAQHQFLSTASSGWLPSMFSGSWQWLHGQHSAVGNSQWITAPPTGRRSYATGPKTTRSCSSTSPLLGSTG